MKVSDIFEAIEPQRPHFERVLNANKEALQKPRMQGGVIKVLSSLFPDVTFTKGKAGGPNAVYDAEKDHVTINNPDKLLKKARRDWDGFVAGMSDLLTHEHIHKEQFKRRGGYKPPKPTKASPEYEKKVLTKFKELRMTYDDMRADGYAVDSPSIQNVLGKMKELQKAAQKHRIDIPPSFDRYLAKREEISAHAETIAAALMRKTGDKQKAIQALRSGEAQNLGIRELNDYIEHNGNDRKTMNQLYKEVVNYLP